MLPQVVVRQCQPDLPHDLVLAALSTLAAATDSNPTAGRGHGFIAQLLYYPLASSGSLCSRPLPPLSRPSVTATPPPPSGVPAGQGEGPAGAGSGATQPVGQVSP